MIDLHFEVQSKWPKLAWVAILNSENCSARIFHGPMVEISDNWAVEGVWDGPFIAGDFDRSDLIFGSGIRRRENRLIFVSSSTAVDRLWFVKVDAEVYVSNTLPGILNASDLSLQDDYLYYSVDMATIITKGLYHYTNKIPSSGPDINIVYYKNIVWDSISIKEIEKPDRTPGFPDFKSYESFLKETSEKIGKNCRCQQRKYKIEMLTGISSGYDSVATSIVSRYAGCRKTVTITNSSSLWRGSDSGSHIAEKLGMDCQQVKHIKKNYKNEIAVWAASGNGAGRNLTLFDYPKPLCLFFNGGGGDSIWDISSKELIEPKGGHYSFTCEFRLIEGFFVTVVPWWGIRKAKNIQKISLLEEMKPWTLCTNYDRPIARRLAEEAGISRGTFAIRKKNTASSEILRWPYSKENRKLFRNYLKSIGIYAPSNLHVDFFSKISFLLIFIYRNIVKKIGITQWWHPWRNFPGKDFLFQWANHTLKKKHYKIQH